MKWRFWSRNLRLEVERSVLARPKTVWAHVMNVTWLDGEAKWDEEEFVLWDGTRIKVLERRPPHLLRFHWIPTVGERTTVEVHVGLQPNGRTQIKIHQEGLPSVEQRDRFDTRWRKALGSIVKTL